MKHALGDRELNRSGDHPGDLFGWYGDGSCRVKRDWAVAGGCKVLWYIGEFVSRIVGSAVVLQWCWKRGGCPRVLVVCTDKPGKIESTDCR